MELDQLKTTWENVKKSSLSINEAELHHILGQSSKSPIAKMKRNLRREIFFLILIYGVFISTISIGGEAYFLFYDAILIIVGIVFMIYARYKYKLLSSMECIGCEIKTNLNLQISSLEKLVQLYFKASNIGIPLAYFFGVFISYSNPQGQKISMPETKELLIIIAIGIVLEFIGYYINRWYLFQLYGKHIQKLKNILYEMDESNSI